MNHAPVLVPQDSGIVTDQSFDEDLLPVPISDNGRSQGNCKHEDDGFEDLPYAVCVPDVLRILPPNDPSFIVSPVESVASEISLPFSEVVASPEVLAARRQSGSVMQLFSPILQQIVADTRPPERSSETLLNKLLTRRKSREPSVSLPLPDFIYEKMDAIMNQSKDGDTSSEESDGGKEDPKQVEEDEPAVKKEKIVEYYDSRARCWMRKGVVDDVIVFEGGGPSGPLEEIHGAIQSDPVPYDILEVSRVKCNDWLDKHYVEGKAVISNKK